jgi:phage gp29-like protein
VVEVMIDEAIETPNGQKIRTTRDGTAWFNVNDLGRQLVNQPSALLEQARRYYGSGLTPETIESVLRYAAFGYMRDLTDLMSETLTFDGHFSTVVGKRHRAVAAARYNVIPASGAGLDEKFAQQCADVVRQQIAWLPNWRQILLRLEWGHFHGRAAAEKIWSYDQSADIPYRISDIAWIHPRRIQFGPQRELRIRDDNFGIGWGGGGPSGAHPTGTSFGPGGFAARGLNISELPLKFITFTPQLFNEYPEREGYGPHCLYHSFFKRFATREQLVLLEVYGKPWRIAYADDASKVQADQIAAGARMVDGLGGNATAFLPPGVKMQTEQPVQGAGTVHSTVRGDAQDEVSKIALGEVRSTASKPSGLGSDAEDAAADVNAEIKNQDATNLSDLLSEQLAVDIIVLNFGADAAIYAPRIELFYEKARDPDKETERATKLITAGIPLKKTEVYEKVGYTAPGEEDDLLVVTPPAAPGGFGPPGLGAPDGAPTGPTRSIELAPTDIATVITVNEARESVGQGPLELQGGGLDPDGNLTVAEYRAKSEAKGEGTGAAEAPTNDQLPKAKPIEPAAIAAKRAGPILPLNLQRAARVLALVDALNKDE